MQHAMRHINHNVENKWKSFECFRLHARNGLLTKTDSTPAVASVSYKFGNRPKSEVKTHVKLRCSMTGNGTEATIKIINTLAAAVELDFRRNDTGRRAAYYRFYSFTFSSAYASKFSPISRWCARSSIISCNQTCQQFNSQRRSQWAYISLMPCHSGTRLRTN